MRARALRRPLLAGCPACWILNPCSCLILPGPRSPSPRSPSPRIPGFRSRPRILAKPGGVLTPPYLPGTPAHFAGPPYFAGPVAPRAPKVRVLSIFGRPGASSKNDDFSTSPKNDQNGRYNRPWGARGSILDQKTSAAPRRVQGVFRLGWVQSR